MTTLRSRSGTAKICKEPFNWLYLEASSYLVKALRRNKAPTIFDYAVQAQGLGDRAETPCVERTVPQRGARIIEKRNYGLNLR